MNWLNDYELLYMIYQQDDIAFCYLVKKYSEEIKVVLRSYMRIKYRFMDLDDFYQIAICKLAETVFNFRPHICSFHTFYMNVLKNTMVDTLRKLNTYSSRCDIYAISLDMFVEEQPGMYSLVDALVDDTYPDTLDSRLNYHELMALQKDFSDLEKEIIVLRGMGNTYKQIGAQLKVTEKKVDYTLRKIRKLKEKLRIID